MNKQIIQNQNQKQIQKQRRKQKQMIEQGKKYVFYQLAKLWSNAHKKRKQEENKEKILKRALQKIQKKIDKADRQKQQQKQKQQQLLLQKQMETEKTIACIKFLFPTNNNTNTTNTTNNTNNKKTKLPPCVRVVARPKPASMKYPNLDAIRQKRRQTKQT